jgi:hypothetical protein
MSTGPENVSTPSPAARLAVAVDAQRKLTETLADEGAKAKAAQVSERLIEGVGTDDRTD